MKYLTMMNVVFFNLHRLKTHFFNWHLRNRKYVPCVYRNKYCRLLCHFLFLSLTSSVIYYWTDPRQHGIYLLNRNTVLNQSARVFVLGYFCLYFIDREYYSYRMGQDVIEVSLLLNCSLLTAKTIYIPIFYFLKSKFSFRDKIQIIKKNWLDSWLTRCLFTRDSRLTWARGWLGFWVRAHVSVNFHSSFCLYKYIYICGSGS